jgi:hypothetical protein
MRATCPTHCNLFDVIIPLYVTSTNYENAHYAILSRLLLPSS